MSKARFVSLDSVRGICAIFVAIYHFRTVSYIGSIPFIQNGFLFVDFFFVLSGFVIASNYGDRLRNQFPISRFMFLRLARLYPLHLFVLLCYLVVAVVKADSGYSGNGFVLTLLLLQTFTEGHLSNWNPPSWSISAEIWTYLVFALLCKLRTGFLPSLLLIVVLAPFILMQFSDRHLDVCYAGALVRCMFSFSLGAMCFMSYQTHALVLSRFYHSIFEVFCILASLTVVAIAGSGPLSFLCPFVFAVTIFVLANEGGFISSILKTPGAVFIGSLSYSIYMIHLFIQARLLNLIGFMSHHLSLPIEKEIAGRQTITNAAGFSFASDSTIIIMIVIVVVCSFFSYTYIESPIRRFSKKSNLFTSTLGRIKLSSSPDR
jgi:peptidoglycan/LPS O-acetylase OafA/YrhL